MLRELQTTLNKPANAMHKATAKVVTGMGVVKKDSDLTFALPTAESAADIFWVDKERIATTGLNQVRQNVSDYDEDFTNVAVGEYAKLIAYYVGERFATDQYVETGLADGVRVAVGTDGKVVKAANTTTSKYVFKGFQNDAGHKLAIIEVSDTPAKNA